MNLETYSYSPKGILATFVDHIWFCRSEIFNYKSVTLPSLYQELVINFSDQFEVTTKGQRVINNERAWLSGLHTLPLDGITTGKHLMAGVLFKPYSLYSLTGHPADLFVNKSIDVEAVFGASIKDLIEKVWLKKLPGEVFISIESFLCKQFKTHSIPPFLLKSIQLLERSHISDGIIGRIANEVGITEKTLILTFKKHLGVTPGKFHHLLILNRILEELVGTEKLRLTDTGYKFDFFDQAHFIHFFKKYSNLSPSDYQGLLRQGFINPSIPNHIEVG